MLPQQQLQSKTASGWEDVPSTETPSTGGWEDVSTVDSLTANPKKQGTYRMVPPSGSDIKSGIMIPYGNIQDARKQGFAFDPHNGDDNRYARDLFAELKGKGKAPSVDPNKNNDEDLTNNYGVVPEPAAGTKEWFQRGGLKLAHGTIDSLPTIGAAGADFAAGVPGIATGPGDIAIVAGANAAGSAAGEGVKQTLNHYIFGENQTPTERAKNIGVEAALGGLMGGGGKIASIPLGKAARSLGLAADESAKSGFRMLPSEAAGTEAGVLEKYPKGSIFTAGTMSKWRELQNQETEKAAKDLADSISQKSLSASPSREEAGNVIRNGIQQHMAKFRKLQEAMYNKVAKSTKNINVDRSDMVAFAKQELKRMDAAQAAGGKTAISPFRQRLQSIVDNTSPVAPFNAMKDLRSELLAQAANHNEILSGPEKGFIKKMSGIIDGSMDKSLQNSGVKGLPELWRSANSITREEHEAFEKKLIENLAAKKNPEDIALVLRGNSPGAISQTGIDETREAMRVIPKNLIPRVQKQIILDTIYETTAKGSSSFNEKQFAKKIIQIGDERGEVLFGKNWKNVKDFAELLNRISDSSGTSGAAALSNPEVVKQLGSLAVEAAAVGAGTHAAGGPGILASAAPLVGQAALWKTVAAALTHPETAEKFLNVLRRSVRIAPYLAGGTYNAVKPMRGKVNSVIEKSKQDIVGDANAIGGQSSVSTPKELIERAKQLNPSAQGQTDYTHIAVNPATGHRIGSNGGAWFDLQTGAKVA